MKSNAELATEILVALINKGLHSQGQSAQEERALEAFERLLIGLNTINTSAAGASNHSGS